MWEAKQKLVKVPGCIADYRSIEQTQLLSLLSENVYQKCFAPFEHSNLGNPSVSAFGDWVFWLVFGDSRGRSCRSFLLSCRWLIQKLWSIWNTFHVFHGTFLGWTGWSLQKSPPLDGWTLNMVIHIWSYAIIWSCCFSNVHAWSCSHTSPNPTKFLSHWILYNFISYCPSL